MPERQFESLGKSGVTEGRLEPFEVPAGILDYVVMESDEVTAKCPITGQPDFYKVEIRYEPNKLCLESKSLKLYLGALRDTGAFGEDLACMICNDVFDILKPNEIEVCVRQKSRGGVTIISSASKSLLP